MADQAAYPPLNQLLGHDENARLLILNADDAGMCHAVNTAVLDVLEAGLVKSTTVMVPAPWFIEMVHLLRERTEFHYGIHLTVTSEWDNLRWGPITDRDKVTSLLDEEGYFHHSEHVLFDHADPDEIAAEFRAQIERALALGLRPTHVDSHMGGYHWDERFFQSAKALAHEFGLTMRIGYAPRRDQLRAAGWIVPDRLVWDSYDVPINDREMYYKETFRRLSPGVTEVLIHPGRPGDELSAACGETAVHREFDWRFFTDPQTASFLESEGIVCIGYDQLQTLQQKQVGNAT